MCSKVSKTHFDGHDGDWSGSNVTLPPISHFFAGIFIFEIVVHTLEALVGLCFLGFLGVCSLYCNMLNLLVNQNKLEHLAILAEAWLLLINSNKKFCLAIRIKITI